jgi:hypothetical protein
MSVSCELSLGRKNIFHNKIFLILKLLKIQVIFHQWLGTALPRTLLAALHSVGCVWFESASILNSYLHLSRSENVVRWKFNHQIFKICLTSQLSQTALFATDSHLTRKLIINAKRFYANFVPNLGLQQSFWKCISISKA